MGFASDIRLGLGSIFRDNENQYVAYEDNKLDSALVIAMNAKGKEKISAKDAALLSKTDKETNEQGKVMDDRQKNSIILYASDKVIRAKNGIERWIKERKANKTIIRNLDKNLEKQGDLPKDDTVQRAEVTNGKIETIAAGELENQPREKGGRTRESRTRR